MRKKGLITVIIIMAIITLISIIFTDQLIETGIEKTIQAVTGAKAEIDDLDVDIFSLGFKWQRLQVADPKKPYQNLIETGKTAFSLNIAALLRKKYVINEITILNTRSGTKRKTDGSLPRQIRKIKKQTPSRWDQMKDKITNNLAETQIFDLSIKDLPKSLNADSLIAKADLQIINNYESLSSDMEITTEKWKTYYSQYHPQEKLNTIKEQIERVEPDKVNTVDKALKEIEKVQAIQNTIKKYQNELSEKKVEAETDYKRLSGYQGQYQQWFTQDYENILKKAQLPDFTLKNVSTLIFGKTVIARLDRYMEYAAAFSRIAGKAKGKKKPKPPRLEGQNIQFSEKQIWPAFLASKIEISTGEEADNQEVLYMEGKITGLTTQPRVYGKPTIIDLRGKYGGNREILFNAVLDRTQEKYIDNYSLRFRNISMRNVKLEESPYLPQSIKKGYADVDIDLRNTDQKMEIVLLLQGKNLEYEFRNDSDINQVTVTIRDIFKGLDRLNLRSKIVITDQTYTFDLTSNLDKRLSQSVSSTATRKLADIQEKVKSRLQEKADRNIAELDKKYGNVYSRYLQPILEYTKETEMMRTELAEKLTELKDKQTEDLGKKAEDLLEELLKKKE